MFLSEEQSNLPAEALAALLFPTVGSSRWKWETFLKEKLKGQLVSSVLWDNAGKEEADLGLGTPTSTHGCWQESSVAHYCLRRSCQVNPSAG